MSTPHGEIGTVMTTKNRRLVGGILFFLAFVAAVYGFGTARANGSVGSALVVLLLVGTGGYLVRSGRKE